MAIMTAAIDVAIMMRAPNVTSSRFAAVSTMPTRPGGFLAATAPNTLSNALGQRPYPPGQSLQEQRVRLAEELDAKRKRQTERVKAICEDLRQGGANSVAVIGDFK